MKQTTINNEQANIKRK